MGLLCFLDHAAVYTLNDLQVYTQMQGVFFVTKEFADGFELGITVMLLFILAVFFGKWALTKVCGVLL